MTQTPVFSSAAEAADLARAGLRYLAAADPTQLTASEQAECLHDLERITAVTTAARANVLGGFTAGKGYCDDAAYSPRAWLIHQTRITKGAATAHTAWVRRARAHPRIMAALAAEEMSEPYARTLCGWTDRLPDDCRDAADAILVAAAQRGMALRDLAALAAEIQSRADPDPDGDGDDDQGKLLGARAARQGPAPRAAASVSGSDGGAWLEGDAAEAFACDASITPIVMGEVNLAVLDDLLRLCVELAGYGHSPSRNAPSPGGDPTPTTPAPPATPATPAPPGPSGADEHTSELQSP